MVSSMTPPKPVGYTFAHASNNAARSVSGSTQSKHPPVSTSGRRQKPTRRKTPRRPPQKRTSRRVKPENHLLSPGRPWLLSQLGIGLWQGEQRCYPESARGQPEIRRGRSDL